MHTHLQVTQQSLTEIEEDHPRMVEICNNHPMFQFLFDEYGNLLTANKRAMYNMKGGCVSVYVRVCVRVVHRVPKLSG